MDAVLDFLLFRVVEPAWHRTGWRWLGRMHGRLLTALYDRMRP